VGHEFDIVANGVLHRGRVAQIRDRRVEFELGEVIPAETAPVQFTLMLAIFKFDRMEWAIEKCTELGVTRMVPVIASRTDAHLASAAVKRADRWRRIALQASEQSRRRSPPEIPNPARLRDIVAVSAKLKIVLSEGEDQCQLRDIHLAGEDEVLLAIGPEGGWTGEELEMFEKQGWLAASLGPTILRAETAAIAATAITMASLGR
jgi:16S rRNA (uracil1498-N3)-methyltransferase